MSLLLPDQEDYLRVPVEQVRVFGKRVSNILFEVLIDTRVLISETRTSLVENIDPDIPR